MTPERKAWLERATIARKRGQEARREKRFLDALKWQSREREYRERAAQT